MGNGLTAARMCVYTLEHASLTVISNDSGGFGWMAVHSGVEMNFLNQCHGDVMEKQLN